MSGLQLDYEPGNSPRLRRARRRWTFAIAFVIIVGLLWWKGPTAHRKLSTAYWEHRLNTYVAPADRVVIEEDPARWPALLARPHYQKMPYTSAGWNPFVAFMAEPVHHLNELGEFRTGETVLFAHSRRAPNGETRLVVVWMAYNGGRADKDGASPDNQVRFFGISTTIIGGDRQADSSCEPWIAPESVARDRTTPLYSRLYAGQVDPKDESHFTIAFEIGEYSDVLDGYLRNGKTVVIRPHKLVHPLNPK